MDFNLIFEILIAFGILVGFISVIKILRDIGHLRHDILGPSNLKVKLKLAKQKKEVLSQKEELLEGMNPTLFSNMFNVINQLLSLQKIFMEKHS